MEERYDPPKSQKGFQGLMSKLRIAVLAGGWSGEREISLKSGESVYKALDKSRYETRGYDPRDDLVTLIHERKNIDLAFLVLHGKYGEDGCMQGFLDLLGIPFLGSGVLASAMAMNKRVAKERYKGVGLKVAEDVVLRRGEAYSPDRIMETLGSSTVVKPVSEGSSIGVSICRSAEDLRRGIEAAFALDEEVLVEEYLKGREVTCCVFGSRDLEALPLIEIVPNPGYVFFDYQAKYTPGASREICPAPLSGEERVRAESCAKEAHRALQCETWSRSDMIIQGGQIFLLETNTIPGMTETSLVPLAARTAGFTFPQFLDRLIELSLEKRHP
jgi:D-alanine-D-alanine ligase